MEEVKNLAEETIEAHINDLHNGRYKVSYMNDGKPGKVKLLIEVQNENEEYE